MKTIIYVLASITTEQRKALQPIINELIADGYTFCDSDMNLAFYKIVKGGDTFIGFGPYDGDAVFYDDNELLNLDTDSVIIRS